MQITEVAYRRTFNLGNYESAQVELRAAVNPGEDAKEAVNALAAEAKTWRKAKATTAEA